MYQAVRFTAKIAGMSIVGLVLEVLVGGVVYLFLVTVILVLQKDEIILKFNNHIKR